MLSYETVQSIRSQYPVISLRRNIRRQLFRVIFCITSGCISADLLIPRFFLSSTPLGTLGWVCCAGKIILKKLHKRRRAMAKLTPTLTTNLQRHVQQSHLICCCRCFIVCCIRFCDMPGVQLRYYPDWQQHQPRLRRLAGVR